MTETNGQTSGKRSVHWVFWLLLAKIIFILLLAGITLWIIYSVHEANSGGTSSIRFSHVLGAGYSSDGKTLWLATADKQLVTYKDGQWRTHKLKGSEKTAQYLPTRNGFLQLYESGTLEWKTLDQATMQRHRLDNQNGLMTIGYATGRIYQLQKKTGEVFVLRWSDDQGRSWQRGSSIRITGNAPLLTASPIDKNQVAIGTSKGLYISNDQGAHFEHFLKGQLVTSAAYSFDPKTSLFAAVSGKESMLYQIVPKQQKTINLDTGTVERDRLIKIVQNPRYQGQAVLLTQRGDLYQTNNGGQNWTFIAQKGRGLDSK
ncbi:group-specific protein [Sporolactobacillus terrae]|uniref:Group-specific protein n=1 Tax=Sporolactobacillus terrae TaxID=269673 RepID=A0A410D7I0_9BACL|nr:group-specific protein [Sporolactobacillus terrae]QAA22053.1 group-specific protein [Sporolactobacillus terrae]QAA25026.1 group-specific protein [Sporolactobacillus terrae]BBN98344.1 hypothetical protein St703_10490 [Sporolactobacillus terrae]